MKQVLYKLNSLRLLTLFTVLLMGSTVFADDDKGSNAATLPFNFNGGYSEIAKKTGLTQSGINTTDYGTTYTKLKFDGTGDYLILYYTGTANILSYDIRGNSYNGGTFKVLTSADGETYSTLKEYSNDNGNNIPNAVLSESLTLPSNTSYIKWIYSKKSTGNIGLGNIKVTQPVVKLNSAGYATFAHVNPIDFSSATDYTAWAVTNITGETVTFEKITGVVPGNTGVLLMGDANGEANITFAASGTAPETNLLTGITAATAVDADTYYGLKGNEFVKVNAGTVPAGKALLPAGQVSGVKAFKFVFEDTDDIQTADGLQLTVDGQEIYDLAGHKIAQRPSSVGTLSKGFYILRSTQSGASHMKNVRKVLVK